MIGFVQMPTTDLNVWTDDLVSLVPDRLYRALDIAKDTQRQIV